MRGVVFVKAAGWKTLNPEINFSHRSIRMKAVLDIAMWLGYDAYNYTVALKEEPLLVLHVLNEKLGRL